MKIPAKWVSAYSNLAMGSGALVGLVTYGLTKPISKPQIEAIFIPFQINSVNLALILILSASSFKDIQVRHKAQRKVKRKTAKSTI